MVSGRVGVTQEEYHLDLLCWVIKGCQILAQLGKATEDPKAEAQYSAIAEDLLVRKEAPADSWQWSGAFLSLPPRARQSLGGGYS